MIEKKDCRLFKTKRYRYDIRDQVGILRIVSIPYFDIVQALPAQHSIWWRYPKPCTKKLAIKLGILVITCVILI